MEREKKEENTERIEEGNLEREETGIDGQNFV